MNVDDLRSALVEISDKAAQLYSDAGTLRSNLLQFANDGYPTGGDGGGRGKGDPVDPTGDAAANGERLRDQWREFTRVVSDARQLLRKADSIRHRQVTLPTEKPPRVGSLQECGNPRCGRTCSGVGSDRLIQGRCRRCAEHRSTFDSDWPTRPGMARATDEEGAA